MSRIVKKPWGREIIWAETDFYVGKILEIEPGHRLSLQYHKIKEETIYVLEGCAEVYLNTETIILESGQTCHILPKDIHRFACKGPETVRLLEVSTNHLSDVVRLSDDYDRDS